MAKAADVYDSKYIKATPAGFIGMPGLPSECDAVILTIDGKLETTEFDDGRKQRVASFRETDKTLGLNVTNWNKIAELTGEDDDDNWDGFEIELCVVPEERSQTGHAIRIRKPRSNTFRLKGEKKAKGGNGGNKAADTIGIDDAIKIAIAAELRGMTVRQMAVRIGEKHKEHSKLVDTPLAAWPREVGVGIIGPMLRQAEITTVVDTDRKRAIADQIKEELAKSAQAEPEFEDDIPF